MPADGPTQKYEIEFDEQGRIRIKDPDLARLIFEHAAGNNVVEIQVLVPPRPLTSDGCRPPVLPPTCPIGCENSMCPMSATVFPDEELEQRWTQPGRAWYYAG